MVSCLSALTRLETLFIKFVAPQSRPDHESRRPPPQTRTLLPVLSILEFNGVSEYLEDLVARIDAPLLDNFRIIFFDQQIFDTPQLSQFISRTPKFKAPNEAHVVFTHWDVSITFPRTVGGTIKLVILCPEFVEMQLSSLSQVCSSSFPQAYIHAVQHLYIREKQLDPTPDHVEDSQWLELLHPFTSVKCLYVPSKVTSFIASALQELVGEGVTEVLPALENLFLEWIPWGPTGEAIDKFVTARQLAGHPITVSRWEPPKGDLDEWQ
jgi:hypothetical protein